MSPVRRVILAVTGLGAALAVLTACDKPAPGIGVLTGSTYRVVRPSIYCFSADTCRAGKLQLPTVTASPDSSVLIDVPRAVRGAGWRVDAIVGKKVIASSGEIRDQHTYRVPATINGGDPFIVRVLQYRDGRPDKSLWNFILQVSQQTS